MYALYIQRYHFNIPVIWSNRIKRVLPLNIPKETLGKSKHELDAWQLIEGIGENDDLNNSAIDLSWYDAKFYQKTSKRLKSIDECEDYNLDLNKGHEVTRLVFVLIQNHRFILKIFVDYVNRQFFL